MRRSLLYIALGMLVLAILVLLGLTTYQRRFDQRISLNKKDKIPYGTYVAFQQLKSLFPQARVEVNKQAPGEYGAMNNTDTNNMVMFIVSRHFRPDDDELTELFRFVEKGNDVFVSAMEFNSLSQDFFHLSTAIPQTSYIEPVPFDTTRTLGLSLSQPPFLHQGKDFTYMGRRFSAYFETIDSSMTYVLGREDTAFNFIRIKAGLGNFYLHTAPLAFSNFFLLSGDNIRYYNEALSVLNPQARKVIWDEYYLYKSDIPSSNDSASPLRVLLAQEAFRWALFTALAAILVFVLLNAKRRQRIIPVRPALRNDSLDFVKTVGRLYFQKKDNRNLAGKMVSYFMEFVSARYKLRTGMMDEEFVRNLSLKSGVDRSLIERIVRYVSLAASAARLTDAELVELNELLDQFYKNA